MPDSVELVADVDEDGQPAFLDADELGFPATVQTGLHGGCVLGDGRGAVDPLLVVLLFVGLIGLSRRRYSA